MERREILSQVEAVFHEVLDDEDVRLGEDTGANDVEGWDSLTHIQLIVAIEKHFKIKFSSAEIMAWKNVGEMLSCIQGKI
jgi:acyl carrier protein